MAHEQMAPHETPAEAALTTPLQAPVRKDGGLYVVEPGDDFETVTIFNRDGRPETRLVTPTDFTGLPYCFSPKADLPPMSMQRDCPHVAPTADLNHMFPKAEVRALQHPLYDQLAIDALVSLRGQWVDYYQHHDVYNKLFVGPHPPDTRANLLAALVLGNLGYIPEHAIDFSDETEPKAARLTKTERRMLWISGQVRVISDVEVTAYLTEHLLNVEADHIEARDIEDLLYSFDQQVRVQKGFKIASRLLERAVEPLELTYREVKAKELLPKYVRVGGKRYEVPERAADFAFTKLTHGRRAPQVIDALRDRFAQGDRRPFSVYFAEQFAA